MTDAQQTETVNDPWLRAEFGDAVEEPPAEEPTVEAADTQARFRALVARVANARQEYEAVKEWLDDLKAEFAAKHADVMNAVQEAKANAAAAEEALREAAIAELHESGDKSPYPGVKVELHTEYAWGEEDETKVLFWARQYAPDAVEVKRPKLRAALNALKKKRRGLPDWAKEKEEPRVKLSTKLGVSL